MVYAISDIHGQYSHFMEMLKTINFSETDEMYVLGDVIDRGEYGIEIIQYIMSHPNIHMLMGNHEHMFKCWISNNISPFYDNCFNRDKLKSLWFRNGGRTTFSSYRYKLTDDEQTKVRRFIYSLPYEFKIEVDGKKFWMFHAFPSDSKDREEYEFDSVWTRIGFDGENIPAIPEDVTVLVGHTPTNFYDNQDKMSVYNITKNIIDIDCGMAHPNNPKARMACVRLNDMKIFYKE